MALEALDCRSIVAVSDAGRAAERGGRHDRPIFAPLYRQLAAELAARLWDASPALCQALALLPDPTKPRQPNAVLLVEALRGAIRWRVDPVDGVPEAA